MGDANFLSLKHVHIHFHNLWTQIQNLLLVGSMRLEPRPDAIDLLRQSDKLGSLPKKYLELKPHYNSGQIIIFHQPGFPWNKGISLTKPPFGVRSSEVAIIWPDNCWHQAGNASFSWVKHVKTADGSKPVPTKCWNNKAGLWSLSVWPKITITLF